MATRYGQYCPIARTAEILGERWTPLLVRNLLFGATTFTAIAQGVPTMSRSVLVSRLRSLEESSVLVRTADGRYLLTEAGYDLATTIADMAAWGERWLEVTSEHHDPAFALWAWVHVQMDRAALPDERVVVEFEFVDQPASNRRWWMLAERGDAEMCHHDPGGGERLWCRAHSAPFCEWHRGVRSWASARRAGVDLLGPRHLVRAIPAWNTHRPVLPPRDQVCVSAGG